MEFEIKKSDRVDGTSKLVDNFDNFLGLDLLTMSDGKYILSGYICEPENFSLNNSDYSIKLFSDASQIADEFIVWEDPRPSAEGFRNFLLNGDDAAGEFFVSLYFDQVDRQFNVKSIDVTTGEILGLNSITLNSSDGGVKPIFDTAITPNGFILVWSENNSVNIQEFGFDGTPINQSNSIDVFRSANESDIFLSYSSTNSNADVSNIIVEVDEDGDWYLLLTSEHPSYYVGKQVFLLHQNVSRDLSNSYYLDISSLEIDKKGVGSDAELFLLSNDQQLVMFEDKDTVYWINGGRSGQYQIYENTLAVYRAINEHIDAEDLAPFPATLTLNMDTPNLARWEVTSPESDLRAFHYEQSELTYRTEGDIAYSNDGALIYFYNYSSILDGTYDLQTKLYNFELFNRDFDSIDTYAGQTLFADKVLLNAKLGSGDVHWERSKNLEDWEWGGGMVTSIIAAPGYYYRYKYIVDDQVFYSDPTALVRETFDILDGNNQVGSTISIDLIAGQEEYDTLDLSPELYSWFNENGYITSGANMSSYELTARDAGTEIYATVHYQDHFNNDEVFKTNSLLIEGENRVPKFTSDAITKVDQDSEYSYQIVAFDADPFDELTYNAVEIPLWLNFEKGTLSLVGTPGNNDVGDYEVSITVTDLSGAYDTQTYTLTVNNINDDPIITSTALISAIENSPYAYTFLASDVDVGDVVTLSAEAKPDWLSFDASTGVLSGTPTNDEVGDHSVTLRATDAAGAYDEQSFTVSVSNVNDDPVVTSSAVMSVDEDASYSYTFTASDIDAGDTLTLSAETKPSWLSFDSFTGVLSGTPTNDDVGDHSVVLRATDASGSYDEQSFTISVTKVNDDPIVTSSKVTFDESLITDYETEFVFHGNFYRLIKERTSFADALSASESTNIGGVNGHLVTVTSIEENQAIWNAFGLDASRSIWIALSDKDEEGTWIWQAGPEVGTEFNPEEFNLWGSGEPNNWNGEDAAAIPNYASAANQWNDFSMEREEWYIVEFEGENSRPIALGGTDLLRLLNSETVPSENTNVAGVEFFGQLNGFDSDNDKLSFSIGSIQPTKGSVEISENGVYTYVPNDKFDAYDEFSFIVSDGYSISAESIVSVTFNEQNLSLPTVSFLNNNQTNIETNEDQIITVPIHLSKSYFKDIVVEISQRFNNFWHARDLKIDAPSVVIPAGQDRVDAEIIIIGDQFYEPTHSSWVQIDAAYVDNIYKDKIEVSGGFDYRAINIINDDDALRSPLLEGEVTINNQSLSLKITPAFWGTYSSSFSGILNFDQAILELNNISTWTNSSITSGSISLSEQINGTQASVNFEANHSSLALDGGWTINFDIIGVGEANIALSDVTLNDITNDFIYNFSYTIEDQKPISKDGTFEVNEDEVLSGNLYDLIDASNSDFDFSIVSSPQYGEVTLNTDGSFVYSPDNNYAGDDRFSYLITHGDINSEPASISIFVSNQNDDPVVTSSAVMSVDEDASYSYTFVASDIDVGDTVILSAETKPDWLSFDKSTSILSGTPTNNDVGDHSVVLRATDGSGAYTEQSFMVSVNNVNDSPTLNPDFQTLADVTIAQGLDLSDIATINFSGAFEDADTAEVLKFSTEGLPDGVSIDEDTGVVSGKPSSSAFGEYSVTVSVTDAGGEKVSAPSFTITVMNTNDAPAVVSEDSVSISAREDAALSYDASVLFSDPDIANGHDEADALTFTLESPVEWLTIDASTGALSGTPDNNDVSSYAFTIKVTATDKYDITAEKEINVTVENKNNAPSASAADLGILSERAARIIKIEDFVNSVTDVDIDDAMILKSLTIQNGSGSVKDNGDNTFTYTPAGVSENKTVTFAYTVSDREGETASSTADLLIVDVPPSEISLELNNKLELVNEQRNLFVPSSSSETYTVTYEDWVFEENYFPGIFSISVNTIDRLDPDGFPLQEFSFVSDDALMGGGFETDFGGFLGDTSGSNVLKLFEGNDFDQKSFELYNSSDSSFSLLTPDPSLSFGNEVTFSASDIALHLMPEYGGFLTAEIVLSDIEYLNDYSSPIAVSASLIEYVDYFALSGDVFQGDILTISEDAISNVSGFAGTLEYNWLRNGSKIEGADSEAYVLTQDDVGQEISVNLVIQEEFLGSTTIDSEGSFTILNVNDVPLITSSENTTFNEDGSYTYTLTASDIDAGDTLTLSAETKPDWLSFDADTGILSGTPTYDDLGNHSVILRATDAAGAYDEQSFVLSVENILPEGQLWDTYRSRANLLNDELTVELLSDYSPTADDPFGSAVSIPGNAILDLRNKSLSISDIPIVIPAVIPPMYVSVSEEIADVADQKDVLIDVFYNYFVSELQLILTVDGVVVEFTPEQVFYQPSPIAQPGPNEENLNVNITIASEFIDELFANSANVIELSHENSALVRLTKLDNDNYLVTKAYTGDYSQTLSKQSFTDAEYNALTYVGDEWTDSVVIGADDVDTIKLSNQNTALYTGVGNDTVILDGNGTFGLGFAALNISSLLQTGTEERINLHGKTRFEDVMDGGADVDTVILTDASDAFFLHDSFSSFHSSLMLSVDESGNSGTARIENIETINAGGGDDIVDLTSPDYSLAGQNITVDGGDGNDTLWGSDTNETLKGGNGDDELFGGEGVNELIGGAGADEFQFTKTSSNDTIADFNISDGDTLKFFNTGGAEFDRDSIVLNSAGDELSIAYGSGVDDALTISLLNAGLQLDDLTADVLIIV